jgi:hypothetical protein
VACGGSSTMSTTPALPIAVSFSSAAPAALQVDATASLTVMVTNDAANAGVKWSVTCGGTFQLISKIISVVTLIGFNYSTGR